MKERFGGQPAPKIEARPTKSDSGVENTEALGVSSKSLESYTKELTPTERGARRGLKLVVATWEAPHGKVPSTVENYLVSTKTPDGHRVELRAMHPESLDEEDLGAMLGDALPRAVGAKPSSKAREALEMVMLERRREEVMKEIQRGVKDEGVRYVCEQLVKRTLAKERMENIPDVKVFDIGRDMLRSIQHALQDGSHVAMPEMQRAIHRFSLAWSGLSKSEQEHARKSIAHATA